MRLATCCKSDGSIIAELHYRVPVRSLPRNWHLRSHAELLLQKGTVQAFLSSSQDGPCTTNTVFFSID